MKIYKDKLFNFIEYFNDKNGMLIRTNILDSKGHETDKEPIMRSFPELIDIGIMGKCHVNQIYCKQFGVDCYQANIINQDMKYENYKKIIDQCKNKTFQVALGGRGDPNKHKDFEKILKYTRENGIVPNLTTTGINITSKEIKLMKKYCGAVAVSLYSRIIITKLGYEESNIKSIEAVNKLVDNNVITNTHHVISNDTIDDIIIRLENNLIPKGINAIIFLLYKPVGIGSIDKVINVSGNKFNYFISLLKKKKYDFKIGFDTCFSPVIISKFKDIYKDSIDICEAARFSCYISPNLVMYPCSFVQNNKFGIDLNIKTIEEGWLSINFKKFKVKEIIGKCPAGLNNFVIKDFV